MRFLGQTCRHGPSCRNPLRISVCALRRRSGERGNTWPGATDSLQYLPRPQVTCKRPPARRTASCGLPHLACWRLEVCCWLTQYRDPCIGASLPLCRSATLPCSPFPHLASLFPVPCPMVVLHPLNQGSALLAWPISLFLVPYQTSVPATKPLVILPFSFCFHPGFST